MYAIRSYYGEAASSMASFSVLPSNSYVILSAPETLLLFFYQLELGLSLTVHHFINYHLLREHKKIRHRPIENQAGRNNFV